MWFHWYYGFAVRGLVSRGWPCTFAPGPRILLVDRAPYVRAAK